MIYVEIALEIKKEITLKFELQERLHYPADSCVEILSHRMRDCIGIRFYICSLNYKN
jgi:hypothetical protein